MSDKTIQQCDLCDNQIHDVGRANGIKYAYQRPQEWDDKDICYSCCLILEKAGELNLIDFDYEDYLNQFRMELGF